MEFLELLRRRRSVRSFQARSVPDELLLQLAESAAMAPSAGNLQSYRVVIVRDGRKLEELGRAALGQEWVSKAPSVLCFCADLERSADRYGRRGWELYAVQDATIACAYAQLRAVELGLGTVWVGAFYERAVMDILELPKELRPIALLSVGYPAEAPRSVVRRGVNELVLFR